MLYSHVSGTIFIMVFILNGGPPTLVMDPQENSCRGTDPGFSVDWQT